MTRLDREVGRLRVRFGEPGVRSVVLPGNSFLDPPNLKGKPAEVCMVVRRTTARLLVFRKTFYPPGVFRLLTGGMREGERILDALRRELHEETGLRTEIARFLAAISYRRDEAGPNVFHTYAFLLDETGGQLGALDPEEQVEEFREVTPDDLPAIADRLERLPDGYSPDLETSWKDWGRFRAVIHRVVSEALAG